MKATGIVRRIDDLGRVVIPKEIRRTMRIREGDPSQTTLKNPVSYCYLLLILAKRLSVTQDKMTEGVKRTLCISEGYYGKNVAGLTNDYF